MSGVTLPPGVKEGSWKLLRGWITDIEQLPTHLRPDGQKVRFLPSSHGISPPLFPVAMVVRLCRSPGQAAGLRPLSPDEAVTCLLQEARSPDGKCSDGIFHSLVQLVRGAKCVELTYSEAADAFSILSEAAASD